MITEAKISLICDGESCMQGSILAYDSVLRERQLRQLEKLGWIITDDDTHYCPACAKRPNEGGPA